MRVIFSRKGFDSTAGGGPSPIVNGKPISLPIPDAKGIARTTYGELGLADHAAKASRGNFGADSLCHHDPMFLPDNTAVLGQCGTAQSHLARQGVCSGDLFLFFGLFAGPDGLRHHRIFGYLRVARVIPLAQADESELAHFKDLAHPHALGMHARNDTLYVGKGRHGAKASDALRLSAEDAGPVGLWRRPTWLQRGSITYFPDRDENWPAPDRMYRVGNGQEFVTDIGSDTDAHEWVTQMVAEIES